MQERTGGTGYTMGMVTSVAPAPSLAPPAPSADAARRIQLVRARRQATGLLVLVAAALVTVHVVADAVTSRTQANWRLAMDHLRQAGAVVTTTETALFQLLRQADTDEFRELARLIR